MGGRRNAKVKTTFDEIKKTSIYIILRIQADPVVGVEKANTSVVHYIQGSSEADPIARVEKNKQTEHQE